MADLKAKNSFGAKETLETGSGKAYYYRLSKLQELGHGNIETMPFSIKVMLEALLRNENGYDVTENDVKALVAYDAKNPAQVEIPFKPAQGYFARFYWRSRSRRPCRTPQCHETHGWRPAAYQPVGASRSWLLITRCK